MMPVYEGKTLEEADFEKLDGKETAIGSFGLSKL